MFSVTDRIRQVEQPRGGYLPISKFKEKTLGGEVIQCTIQPIMVGKIIDSMLHIVLQKPLEDIFRNSLNGYATRVDWFAHQFSSSGYTKKEDEVDSIIAEDTKQGINVMAIIKQVEEYYKHNKFYDVLNCVYMLHQYDIWVESFGYVSHISSLKSSKPKRLIQDDAEKLFEMYKRTIDYIISVTNGYLVTDYKFYPNGYTDLVKYGVGDFICNYTMFDLKCTKNKPNNYNTLQLLMYYCMGLNSDNKLYKYIKKIGMYSPICNKVWTLPVSEISEELIQTINNNVLNKEV